MSGIKITAADRTFAKAIKTRDEWRCVRCGSSPDPRGLHCAHGFTRRTQATRVEMSNAMALCYGCHQFVDSHADEKERLFRWKFGDEEYDRVAAMAHQKRDRKKRSIASTGNDSGSSGTTT